MNNKLETISNLFEGNEIRSIWDSEKEDYYFSVVDVISVLTNSNNPRNYWNMLKARMTEEEQSELSTKCVQLKLQAKDGKLRLTDTLDTKGILRLIESIPSPKAEPFKLWLANLGSERIDEVFDPELAVNRAITYYHNKGYSDEWIKRRLSGIVDRFKLTDVWKEGGITKPIEYAMLTNEIYKGWSGMTAKEFKQFKGLRKESLRDNMSDIEVTLADLGEIATREIAKKQNPKGMDENIEVARRGGKIANNARIDLENELGESVITQNNVLNYKYQDENKLIDNN